MKTNATNAVEEPITCSNCEAICCRMEVMIITDTGVPDRFIKTDKWGGETMNRLDDGWCAALNRNTMMCSIYESRPLICREFAMGESECIDARHDYFKTKP
ncbi:YkgJ family cysteine cluster protein [Alkalimarinus sediminis]|uniref:YkgJ family cysteine cluster protein n=1 Tax=Alkalimarinus sediminis TaxID=1632866 RepID=A0A9E8KQD9_9ALTE|nr:YkgJ family cysteine cluster protein [Alkalimarinus sediminis]UZW76328.1 YkgJ family cysteine cluster protein [Alkalimarinus sediminis]